MNTSKATRLFILTCATALFGCATEGGGVSNGVYTSPVHIFKVPVPELGPDAEVKDSASDRSGSVRFSDGHGYVLRIEYVRMGDRARHADPERRDYA